MTLLEDKTPADAAERVSAWLERLNISNLADRSASTLSGGEAQRTSLADISRRRF